MAEHSIIKILYASNCLLSLPYPFLLDLPSYPIIPYPENLACPRSIGLAYLGHCPPSALLISITILRIVGYPPFNLFESN